MDTRLGPNWVALGKEKDCPPQTLSLLSNLRDRGAPERQRIWLTVENRNRASHLSGFIKLLDSRLHRSALPDNPKLLHPDLQDGEHYTIWQA